MKNRYEGLLILNVKGTEEGAKEVIERLEGEFKKEGAKIEQVQRMDRRNFTYTAGPLSSGYYANFVFESDPKVIAKLKAKFKLDADVYRQHYLKLRATRAKTTRKAARKATKPRKVKAAA